MQPFDALSIRAVLHEARPLIVGKRVDGINQLGRDEIIIALRDKHRLLGLFISAHATHGRICLISNDTDKASLDAKKNKQGVNFERYTPRQGNTRTVPPFCQFLRKHLTGATLIAVESQPGERIADFVFSCLDQVGTPSIKILTAEIMGKHSNLIVWEKSADRNILAASHAVTAEMSRHREVTANAPYIRPPGQDRPNIFTVSQKDLLEAAQSIEGMTPDMVQAWLSSNYAGLGRHLSKELAEASKVDSPQDGLSQEPMAQRLWQAVNKLQNLELLQADYFAYEDQSGYSLTGWSQYDDKKPIRRYKSANDLIEDYYRRLEAEQLYKQTRNHLLSELKQEIDRLQSRIDSASNHLPGQSALDLLKIKGDLILANMTQIAPGQTMLMAQNYVEDRDEMDAKSIEIALDTDSTPAQNAQSYYRQYARARAKSIAAAKSIKEAQDRKILMMERYESIEAAKDLNALRRLKDEFVGKKQTQLKDPQQSPRKAGGHKVLSVQSSDGWTIYVGRNRNENDYLLSKLGHPNDLWFHVLGQGGAHVLVKIPSSKQEPPQRTITEAADIAARLSKATHGTKVRVIYTQCKHVKKLAREKPGMVRYEQEKTIEIDTAKPMPQVMKNLFRLD